MNQTLVNILKKVPLCRALANRATQMGLRWAIIKWERNGRPVPPPHMVKQRMLRRIARRYGLRILVETGTYYGDMVEAMKMDFERIYSIELSQELCGKARERFRRDKHIKIVHGDSARELESVIDSITQPALFWLDGHYSSGPTAKGEKDTPVIEELEHIFDTEDPGHVIVIDDARNFGTCAAYPSMEEILSFIRAKRPAADVVVEDDCIIITPAS